MTDSHIPATHLRSVILFWSFASIACFASIRAEDPPVPRDAIALLSFDDGTIAKRGTTVVAVSSGRHKAGARYESYRMKNPAFEGWQLS